MIGIFNDNFPPILDGVALTTKSYADWLSRKGKDVCVVTPYAPQFPENLTYPIYSYISVPIPGRPPYRFGMPHIDPNFLLKYRSLKFELIHAHCPFTTGALALRTAKKQGIPVVATFHSKYRQDFEHSLPGKHMVDFAVKRIINFFDQADEVWIPQAAVEETLREYGYKGQVEVVENGNDFVLPDNEIQQRRRMMRINLELNRDQVMLLYVGQHIWEKNIGLTLQALEHIKHLPFKMYMIGNGYASNEIKNFIRTKRLEKKIIMLGNVYDRNILINYYAAADLFLFPSKYDTLGLVVKEAAALQTPSVLLAGSTAAAQIVDGYNGFLTENNVESYAELITQLMENRQLRKDVGIRAYQTLARSWESVVDEVINRYNDIIKRYKLVYK